MLEHNTRLTHLRLMRKTLNSTIDCIVNKLKSLVDFELYGKFPLLLWSVSSDA